MNSLTSSLSHLDVRLSNTLRRPLPIELLRPIVVQLLCEYIDNLLVGDLRIPPESDDKDPAIDAHNPILTLLRMSHQLRQVTLEVVSEILGIELKEHEGEAVRLFVPPSSRITALRRLFASRDVADNDLQLEPHRSASPLLDCYYFLASCNNFFKSFDGVNLEPDHGRELFEILRRDVQGLCTSFYALSPDICGSIYPRVFDTWQHAFRELIYGFPNFLFGYALIMVERLDTHYAETTHEQYVSLMDRLIASVACDRIFNEDQYNHLKSQFPDTAIGEEARWDTVYKAMAALLTLDKVIKYGTRPGSGFTQCQESAKGLHPTFKAQLAVMVDRLPRRRPTGRSSR